MSEPTTLTGLASELSSEFNCDIAVLFILQGPPAKSTDLMVSGTESFEEWAHPSYTGYYRRRDIWSPKALSAPGSVVISREVIDQSVLYGSEFYADFCRKADFSHVIQGKFAVNGEIGVLNMGRAERASGFDDHDKQRLEILIPHLQRAVQIHQRLNQAEHQRTLTLEVLERLDVGIFILEADARVLFANAVGRRVLHAGRDLATLHGSVRPMHASQVRKFERAVHDAAMTSIGRGMHGGGLVSVDRPERAPLSLLISPYRPPPGSVGCEQGAALVVFLDPDAQTAVPERVIAQMFGLAPAQARLLAALVAGETMADYADSAGITMNTVKTQMRHIFLKTGLNRQADLIRTIASNPLIKLTGDRSAD